MKKVLLIMAAALMTMTQCRKQETMPSMPSADTVKMTITAGPGRTDINTETGAITWSKGDKLYVSKNGSWLGCLELVSGENTANGTFAGDVTGIGDGDTPCHFFYLGKGNIATTPTGENVVSISFATQDGSLRGENGAMKYHIGYGNTSVTVTEGEATGSVIMNTKIAIAHINFTTDGTMAYTGSVTMGGTGVSNTLSVSPDGIFSGSGDGGIAIDKGDGTTGERFVTLIPTGTTDVLNVAFTGDATGGMTFANGIQANKFYGMKDAVKVTVTEPSYLPGEFSVSGTTKVKFSKGNLYWDGTESKFKFEANQWSTTPASDDTWNPSHVSHFFWSKTASVAYAASYSGSGSTTSDVFFTNATQTTANPDFHVNGETGTNQWRTLSNAEWSYLLNTRNNASSLRAWVTLSNVSVSGLVLLPDGSTATASGITTSSALADAGAVFLPAAGYRNYRMSVYEVGSHGRYWSSTTPDEYYAQEACGMVFVSGDVVTLSFTRDQGYAVRLVR